MQFRILGPFAAAQGSVPIDLGPHRQRSLLALLLLHPNRVVPSDRIMEELWGAAARGKENALWVHVSRLRSALEPGRDGQRPPRLLVTRDHGYELQIDPRSIDAHRFEAAAASGRALVAADADQASAVLAGALALWRGAALQDFAYEEFARAEAERLECVRLDVVEDRVEADLRRGLAGELVGELQGVVRRHPFRERPVRQLMLALYRAGRQAEALRAFDRYRHRVAEDLGLEPSPELRRLQERVVRHDLHPTDLAR